MRKISALLLLAHILVLPLVAQSQSTKVLSDYIKEINQFNKRNPQEKVYLHFDNTGYFLGDTIWFKAYNVLAEHHRFSPLSKVLHVELLTPQGEVIANRKLMIENGQCHGEFPLKRIYRSGFYEVRAYTRGMLNFGDDCVFSRVFPVYDEPEKDGNYSEKAMDSGFGVKNKRKIEKKGDKVNIAFFPEGGNAVVGLASRIGFKAWGEKGEDLHITGAVYNSSGNSVSFLSTYNQGMGFFELLPETTSYKVIVEHEGKKYDFNFSDILPVGYVMRINDSNEEAYQIEISKSPVLPRDTIAVSVSCRGTVYAVEAMRLADAPYVFQLPKSRLPAGCIQFTLYDKKGNILAERLSFNTHPLKYHQLSAQTEKPTYAPLEKVNMGLSLNDSDGNPVESTFSISVRDAGTEIYTSYQDNILTDLLLSSDIKGYVANPMQYFEKDDRATRMKLDLLMMVQGWCRYDWQTMADISPFRVKHYIEQALPINGKIMEMLRNKTKAYADVIFWMNQDKSSFHSHCKTDANGLFYFMLPDSAKLEGKWQLSLSVTEKKKLKHCRIMLDRHFSPVPRSYSYSDLLVKDTVTVLSDEYEDSLKQHFVDEMQYLPQVTIKKQRIKKELSPEFVYDVEKDVNELIDLGKNYPGTLGEYMENYIPHLRRDSADGPFQYAGKNIVYFFEIEKGATRYPARGLSPEQMPIENIRQITLYDRYAQLWAVKKIKEEGIEAASPSDIDLATVASLSNTPVIIMVHPYNDGLHYGYQKGIRHTFYYGYSQVKKFYHINHSNSVPGDIDFRRTLYWNPNVKTNSQGKAQISFYNNTTCRRMKVSAEGLSDKGIPVITQE